MLILYDNESGINWVEGFMTREEMNGNVNYPPVDEYSVLFENEDGTVYDWRYLFVLAQEYGVEMTDDPQSVLDSVIEKMNYKPTELTLEQVNETAVNAESIANLIQEQINALTSAFEVSEVTNA